MMTRSRCAAKRPVRSCATWRKSVALPLGARVLLRGARRFASAYFAKSAAPVAGAACARRTGPVRGTPHSARETGARAGPPNSVQGLRASPRATRASATRGAAIRGRARGLCSTSTVCPNIHTLTRTHRQIFFFFGVRKERRCFLEAAAGALSKAVIFDPKHEPARRCVSGYLYGGVRGCA